MPKARTAEQQQVDIMLQTLKLAKLAAKIKPWLLIFAGMWIFISVGLMLILVCLLLAMFTKIILPVNGGALLLFILAILSVIPLVVIGHLWKKLQMTEELQALLACDTSNDFRQINKYFHKQPMFRLNNQADNLITAILNFADGKMHLFDMSNIIILISRLDSQTKKVS